MDTQYSKAALTLTFLCYNIFTYLISTIAKANPFEDARVEEQEELFENEGNFFFRTDILLLIYLMLITFDSIFLQSKGPPMI